MNTFEFEALKAELARNILSCKDPEVIERVRRSYEEALECTSEPPCRYTLDEVKARLRATEADAIAGRGLTTEEVMKLSEEWI